VYHRNREREAGKIDAAARRNPCSGARRAKKSRKPRNCRNKNTVKDPAGEERSWFFVLAVREIPAFLCFSSPSGW
jgi:hypothetical protein